MGERAIRRLPQHWCLSRKGRRPDASTHPNLQDTDIYVFGLHEMDDLFTAMFAASSINPRSSARVTRTRRFASGTRGTTTDLFGSPPL
jgi:hypothetical protein